MSARKAISILFAGAMLATTMPAFADHEFRRFDPRFEPRVAQFPAPYDQPVFQRGRTVAVHGQPVYHGQPHYRGQPDFNGQPYYRGRPVYAEPAPVYTEPVYVPQRSRDNTAIGVVGGALIGAMIGSNVGYGPDRAGAMAAGAVIGGMLGLMITDD